jgi:hypothetical protein
VGSLQKCCRDRIREVSWSLASAKFTAEAQAVSKEAVVKKWGKYLPVVALLLFPGGMFIVGAWLALGHIRHGDDLAEDCSKSLADYCKRKEEGR